MKKIAYIIGISQPSQGLLTLYKHIASHILYAKKMGYIPIVDCKHYINQYFKDKKTYIDNSWEYFFEQPEGYTLDNLNDFDEIIISQNVEWADTKYEIVPSIMSCQIEPNSILHEHAEHYAKYLKLNEKLLNDLEHNFQEKAKKDVVLGVLCRGSDYINLKPAGHSIQPSPEEVISKIKEIMSFYSDITKIYLATEDALIYKKFKDVFGSILIENDQYLFLSSEQKALSDIKVSRENHFYNLGKEYLASLYILSKCPYFIGGRNNGSLGVYLMSMLFSKQKFVYIWDLGFYGSIKYNSFFEKIFSIKREYTFPKTKNRDYSIKKCHIYITILGIKLRFSKNYYIDFNKNCL